MGDNARRPTRRVPLGEATRRVNNAQQPRHDNIKAYGQADRLESPPPSQGDYPYLQVPQDIDSPETGAANPRLSAISQECTANSSNRNSQISTNSENSEGKRLKTYIGPWKLGKTLGKGATARVRLARHAYTGQEAAIKIVQKMNAQISQAGSLAALDRAESAIPDSANGLRHMPVGIEREVAIMKLIQHPNIMKLYDIWENRTEIYLVLEYVDNGELFDHISSRGRLDEVTAIRYFRQILSAVGYCHSFNICHRDLKPENILLTKGDQIKIADFGMAALHQSPDHKLKTSCGSPHYAAPELIRGSMYRGDLTDIWSLGVILYASLAGRLPFDVGGAGPEWLAPLLQLIKKGQYEMSPLFSNEASSLIRKMLTVDPKERITLKQIWRHPLLRKYDYLDDLGHGNYPHSPNVKDCGRPVLRRSDIDIELFRHLRSMWHTFSEQQLMDTLLSEQPNDQKLFYKLLLKYRDTQLENYTPDLDYSSSDYHHIKPQGMARTYSTCHFPQPTLNGHARQVSKFTVISNAAETEQSYDPFRASRPQHIDTLRYERAKVTIHRNRAESKAGHPNSTTAQNSGSTSRKTSMTSNRSKQRLVPPKAYASRSSLASSTRSRNSAVRANITYKRGVSFNHMRKNSGGSQKMAGGDLQPVLRGRHSNLTEVAGDDRSVRRPVAGMPLSSARYIRSRKAQPKGLSKLPSPSKPGHVSVIWGEDVRQLSSSLAKDCDEAFNGIGSKRGQQEQVLTQNPNKIFGSGPKFQRNTLERPLPPTPPSDPSKFELFEARKQAELRKQYGKDESIDYLDRLNPNICLSAPTHEQRAVSAPVEPRRGPSGRPLPSIFEARNEDHSTLMANRASFLNEKHQYEAKNGRTASAPEHREGLRGRLDRLRQPDGQIRDTIRVVKPSVSMESPIKPPAPLTIRKKSSQGGPMMSGGLGSEGADKTTNCHSSGSELRQQYNYGQKGEPELNLGRIEEDEDADYSISGTVKRKRSSWFKRNSKNSEDDCRKSTTGSETAHSRSSTHSMAMPPYERPGNPHLNDSQTQLTQPSKKKVGFSFSKIFKKRLSRPDMSVNDQDVFDDEASVQDSLMEANSRSYSGRAPEDPRLRQIAPRRNWLAKIFKVKPASMYICFALSRRRARREITGILREWKRYGIKDVQVDKERNIVFGKVVAKNYLDMKEVAFAVEIMTVIEHGNKAHLSIARFTLERGAFSSFQKVVETLETVLKCRGGLLVADEHKARMMIQTLSAA